MRKPYGIKQDDKYVGGYSVKTGRVWLIPQKFQAKRFLKEEADLFILDHAHKEEGLDSMNISIIRLDR